MSFLFNAWYMIGWADEFTGEALVARTMLKIPVVAWRDAASGAYHALEDTCPHRFAPLSEGKLVNGRVQCGYHGLEFDGTGQCRHNPFNKVVPSSIRTRSFPIAERPGAVWVWMGDPARADEALIPDVDYHADPTMRYVKGSSLIASDYRLITDNLMDLCHSTFLHPSFGGLEYMPQFRSEERPDGVIVCNYHIPDMINIFGPDAIPAERIRNNDNIRWIAPSVHILESRAGLVGSDEYIVYVPSAHILTPQDETSTHYFWSSGCDKDLPVPDEALMEVLKQAFDGEDKPMLEAVQRRMAGRDLWDMDPVLLPTDAGAVRVRRKMAAMIAAEREEASVSA